MVHDAQVQQAREQTQAVTARFPDDYWRDADLQRAYPQEFVDAMGASGLLAAMIPSEYGGHGWGIGAASAVMEEINASGGHSAACHAQMTGHKTWTSRIVESDLVIVLARTSPRAERPTEGMTLFLVDLRDVRAHHPEQVEIIPVRTMFNYATNQVEYHGLRVPADAVLGEVRHGFRYVIDGWNAERTLLAAEAIGDARWFVERAVSYSQEREVFGRPIAVNQGIQFPIADAYMRMRAADAIRWEACDRFDSAEPCGAEANMAKWLAAEASWEAANMCLDTHGGFGFVDTYDVERKFRETRVYGVAPVSSNMIRSFVATKVLGLPKSY